MKIIALLWGSYVRFKKSYYQPTHGYKYCHCAQVAVANYERHRELKDDVRISTFLQNT